MVVFPNVKINIGLFITAKRPDGYHNIESVFYPVPFTETIEITLRNEDALPPETFAAPNLVTTVGNVRFLQYGNPIPGNAEGNLCIKVYQKLEEWYQLPPIDLHLLKTLPIGAGLGGGSADAAFTLRALIAFFNLNVSSKEAMDLLASLGSDCPFFWNNKPAFVYGRGEQMRSLPLDLSAYHILLVHPGIHISTQEAYAGVSPKAPPIDLQLLPDLPVAGWKEVVYNDFESHLFEKYPLLPQLKTKLYELGADYAAMSGSGSALYGLFPFEPAVPQEWRDAGYTVFTSTLAI